MFVYFVFQGNEVLLKYLEFENTCKHFFDINKIILLFSKLSENIDSYLHH